MRQKKKVTVYWRGEETDTKAREILVRQNSKFGALLCSSPSSNGSALIETNNKQVRSGFSVISTLVCHSENDAV